MKPKEFYPLNLEPRQQQLEMIDFAAKSISKTKKYILLNAPTGIGKSYFSIMLINWYLNNVDEDATFDIITNSKVLQQQYVNDYKFISNLKGRSNYRCDKFDTNCEKGMELCSALKKQCDVCPYKIAKNKWMKSQVSVTNFHLFNTFCMYNESTMESKERDSRVLFIDEAHDFESVYSDFITIKLSAKTMNKYGFTSDKISSLDKRISKIKNVENVYSFLKMFFINEITDLKIKFEKEIEKGTNEKRSTEITKYITHIDSQLEKFKNFIKDYESEPIKNEPNPKENWVLDKSKNDKNTFGSGIELVIQPIWVYKYLPKYIWNRYDHIIFMSGTILNKKMFSFINGLDPKLTTFKSINSPFLIKKRPIYYIKTGKMTYNEKEETFKKQKKFINKIINKNKGKKGIIHTTTYEFSNWIQNSINNSRLIFHENTDREERLSEHLSNKRTDSVIVSPSMHTGIDLKDDLSRFQIIMKIPYPNISSNKIKQRQKTNKEWYNWKTVVDLIQGLGRSVRSENDYAESYVLDSSFSSVLMYNSHLIPNYITDAIKEIKLK